MEGKPEDGLWLTTGTCAAAAAQGAARLLLTGEPVESVSILTPKGIRLRLPIRENRREGDRAVSSVVKYAGDDPDVTDGVEVLASVEKIPGNSLEIDGGVGVGRVTRPGLDQPVGNAAINRVPRQMIRKRWRTCGGSWAMAAACGWSSPFPPGSGWRPKPLTRAGNRRRHLRPGDQRHCGAHERGGLGGHHRRGGADAGGGGRPVFAGGPGQLRDGLPAGQPGAFPGAGGQVQQLCGTDIDLAAENGFQVSCSSATSASL